MLSPKKIVEVKDKWVKVRVTMDSGAAGHVMPKTILTEEELQALCLLEEVLPC